MEFRLCHVPAPRRDKRVPATLAQRVDVPQCVRHRMHADPPQHCLSDATAIPPSRGQRNMRDVCARVRRRRTLLKPRERERVAPAWSPSVPPCVRREMVSVRIRLSEHARQPSFSAAIRSITRSGLAPRRDVEALIAPLCERGLAEGGGLAAGAPHVQQACHGPRAAEPLAADSPGAGGHRAGECRWGFRLLGRWAWA
eukprot:scaffold770_cov255-Pinguiococcus_pyrenoidosus.AAC.18